MTTVGNNLSVTYYINGDYVATTWLNYTGTTYVSNIEPVLLPVKKGAKLILKYDASSGANSGAKAVEVRFYAAN